jgi:diguanylate cyclase (GGDEF)-like protein
MGPPLAAPASPLAALPPALPDSRLVGLLAELVGAAHADQAFAGFWEALSARVPLAAGALFRVRELGGLALERAWGWEGPAPAGLGAPELEAYAAACRVPVASADLEADPRFARPEALAEERVAAALALPLVAGDQLLGVLGLYRREARPFGPEELSTLELAGAALAQALESLGLREKLAETIARDPLTGVAAHRAFMERLGAELKRAERFALPLSALLIDLDGFARHNDAHGYALGDEALRLVGELVAAQARPADLVARFSGDAFAVLLPECAPPEALAIGEQIRLAVAASLFPGRRAGGAKLTASVGVTGFSGPLPERHGFVAGLRQALARAQAEGENRLVFHAALVPSAEPAAPAGGAPPAQEALEALEAEQARQALEAEQARATQPARDAEQAPEAQQA